MNNDFFKAVKERRSFYAINKEVGISDEKIQELVEEAVKYSPSAFNSQSARAVVLLSANHDKIWDITMESLHKIVPADKFASTEERINSFKNGYGTILFFEDAKIIENFQEQFASYKDNFPNWSQQSSGMLQYVVWTALEAEGLGASLQHYNNLIETEVKAAWQIPATWQLISQMPFGKPFANPNDKEFAPIEDRVKIIK